MVILASKSPRRKELLSTIFPVFDIIPSNIDESKIPEDKLSEVKGMEIAKFHPHDLIISADTLVVFNDKVYGKPHSKEEAYSMLKSLSGNVHKVVTYFSIIKQDENILVTKHSVSKVLFNSLSNELILSYIETGSPFDKAGGYGIQDNDFNLVKSIEGSLSNVVGLPIEDLREELNKLGFIPK